MADKSELILATIKHLSHGQRKEFTAFQIIKSIQLTSHSSDWCLMPFSTFALNSEKLEDNGLIVGEWKGEGEERRKYYRLVK